MSFLIDTAVSKQSTEQEGIDTFSANVSSKWGVAGVPNGGYLMATLANAVNEVADKKALLNITANFLNRTKPGAVNIETSVMTASRQFERRQVSLFQDGKETIRAMTIAAENHPQSLDYQAYIAPQVEPRKKCLRLLGNSQYTLFSSVCILVEFASTAYLRGKKNKTAEHRGWIRLKDNEEWNAQSIIFASDAVSPPILSLKGMSPWVPTLEMSVQVRQMPQTKWLKFRFKTRFLSEEYLEEDGELWDENGNLIAISRQLAMYRPAELPLAQRAALKAYALGIRMRRFIAKDE